MYKFYVILLLSAGSSLSNLNLQKSVKYFLFRMMQFLFKGVVLFALREWWVSWCIQYSSGTKCTCEHHWFLSWIAITDTSQPASTTVSSHPTTLQKIIKTSAPYWKLLEHLRTLGSIFSLCDCKCLIFSPKCLGFIPAEKLTLPWVSHCSLFKVTNDSRTKICTHFVK